MKYLIQRFIPKESENNDSFALFRHLLPLNINLHNYALILNC